MKLTEKPNRLINEKSPYLLQHAHNPVDWYPWGDEAFAKAKADDKPIFLSIGYSTCHWCHVMERESFEDEEVAALLNEHFVSIKVDREERPDIDTIYMSVCQAITGHGGWPLTIIMTPDKKPFYAGTYFPKRDARGMPGLMTILSRLAELWQENKEDLITSGNKITEAVSSQMFVHVSGEIDQHILDQAYEIYKNRFDPVYGGFGSAPKFPTPHNLSYLLRYWKMTGKKQALEMVEKTLESMYRGGIFDHIGYGFARYSVDQKWLVPHFEKMLYDNALLAIAYLEAYQATGKDFYKNVAENIFEYVIRDMTSPEGAFYSAEDADSEGEEGKFYVWSEEEIKEVLGESLGRHYCEEYDITPRGNFEGKSIPNLIKTGLIVGYEEAREKLFAQREQRVHPFKDDKILTAWNGLMIAALAFGARVLAEPKYADAAEKATAFIQTHLCREDGRLLARFRKGEAAYLGYLDDYSFFTWGLIELYEATFKAQYLESALKLSRDMLKLFWDEQEGGFYLYGTDAENLIARPKEIYDGAMPSGNSVAALNLLRLARLTESPELKQLAEKQLTAFGGSVFESPTGYSHFLMAVWFNLTPPIDIKITGSLDSRETRDMIKAINRPFSPETIITLKSTEDKAISEKTLAYICKDFTCQPPVDSAEALETMLRGK